MASRSFEALEVFFESSPAARRATRPLARGAEVALALDEGVTARFTMESGAPEVLLEEARAPDFTLTLPERAVEILTGLKSDDVGELGVEFFKLVLTRDPAKKVRVRIDSPTVCLLQHGYLRVLALGGMRVAWWLLEHGVKNPKAALDRLRGGKS